MGLNTSGLSMGTHFRIEAKMWFQLSHDLWFNFTLMPFRASANARCSEPPPPSQGSLDMLRMPARAFGILWRWMDNGWMDGRTGDGRMDCLYVHLFGRIGG